MHREIATVVIFYYWWNDPDLGHGYQMQPNLAENDQVRFTISSIARTEVLRSFAELNRQH